MKIIWMITSWTVALLLVAGGANYSRVSSGDQAGDYWYTETLQVDENAVPAGIKIITSDPAVQPRGYMDITNANKQPVYVMSLGYKDVLVMPTPDENWKSRVNGANEAASYLAAPNHPVHLTIESFTSLDQNLEDRNVLSAEPSPEGQLIPASQNSELLLVYDEQVIEVPFSLSYTLNKNFNKSAGSSAVQNTPSASNASPTAIQQAEGPSGQTPASRTLVAGIAGIATVIVIGWLVWRSINRSK